MSRMSDEFRRKADELLSRATQEGNLHERSRLIDEAAHWHRKALAEAGHAMGEIDGQMVGAKRRSEG